MQILNVSFISLIYKVTQAKFLKFYLTSLPIIIINKKLG